jgi:crotonobetainyl-CoA:carnitine CoA-transferase CaiB-like acyl-CoA transferase
MDRLQKRGVPAGVVQKSVDRYTRDPQLKERGYFVPLPHSEIGTWPIEDFPATVQNMPLSVGGLPGRGAPCMGEDNDTVYRDVLGLSVEEIAQLREDWII